MASSDPDRKPAKRRVRFERNPSQVMFDPSSSSFVVTWSKCGLSDDQRLAAKRDPSSWIPSVGAVATLFDRGVIPSSQAVAAAKAVGRAIDAGDRDGLDTEEARKAAELVRDIAMTCTESPGPAAGRDLGQAMRRLLDEMAVVRFMGLSVEALDDMAVMPPLDKSLEECFAIPGFSSWPHSSMRRRLLYCLNRKERTPVAYTLVSLLFDTGACPLLSLPDRRMIRMRASARSGMEAPDSAMKCSDFLAFALSDMRTMKNNGRSRMELRMTQQQLADSVAGSSPA